ncbi:hypothetical protein CB0940_07935 [Cercospora beticola]|uniref:Transcription factor domain-containing protein n=1 Tax=Cercospora beticola TaxID=122368 RepID=A0A2G5HB04_CERBT|nr:hypothetical protein CB0940_07935 [Cercospora beticola]PIA89432.1 hypothetical protein CB0940_07935 [Cercospora beticola]WPB03905.1 hypothetical protein RHO25_008549 [Cercospora beticola]CAK1357312.1 unnamed protein product [Cercospora beticola]
MATFIHENFEDDTEDPPGFMFVVCDEQNGKAPKQSKALRKRHVMRNHKASIRDGGNQPVVKQGQGLGLMSCLGPAKIKASRTPSRTATCRQQYATSDVSSMLMPASPYESVRDVVHVWQWFFYEDKADGTKGFDVARHHFIEMQWHQARSHEVHLCAAAMYAYRKEAQIAGGNAARQKPYLHQKGQLIKQIQKQVDTYGAAIDSGTLVAVAILAFSHLQDAEFHAAGIHIHVLRAIKALERLSVHQWLIIAWLDLRLALNLNQLPLFDLYIPKTYRASIPDWQINNGATVKRLANACTVASPSCSDAEFGKAQICDLFTKLFQLFLAWPYLKETRDPPFGHIYELEYLIRFYHPRLARHESSDGSDATCTELLLLTIQLNLWILCRFWTPIQQATRACVLERGLKLLTSIPDILRQWIERGNADMHSLLWVAATFAACEAADRGAISSPSVAGPVMRKVMEAIQIELEDLPRELKNWPFIEDCHFGQHERLWKCSLNEDESLTIEVAPDSWWSSEDLAK